MAQIAMVARRVGTDFEILADGFVIGRLADCEACHVFVSNDDELMDWVRIEGDMSIREMLAAIRKGYEAYVEDMRKLHAAELHAETAWLRHAERYDPEAQFDLELHDFLS